MPRPQGDRRVMDCIDCHNRAAHTLQTAEDALNRAMAERRRQSRRCLGFTRRVLNCSRRTTKQKRGRAAKSPRQLTAFYRSEHPEVLSAKAELVKSAGEGLVTVFTTNVFPEMKVTWGTHPNHIGHMSYPGCFRCHDGDHTAKDGTSITQDCAACHNLLAVDEAKPKVLADLGIQ